MIILEPTRQCIVQHMLRILLAHRHVLEINCFMASYSLLEIKCNWEQVPRDGNNIGWFFITSNINVQKTRVHRSSVLENCFVFRLFFQEKCKLLLKTALICIYLLICALNCLLNRKQQTCPFQEHKLLGISYQEIFRVARANCVYAFGSEQFSLFAGYQSQFGQVWTSPHFLRAQDILMASEEMSQVKTSCCLLGLAVLSNRV